MKINKEEIKPTSNSVYNTKDKDHFRTYYFLFIYEIIENEALYSKETRDVKLKTIGNVSNLNVSNFTANLIYKDKKIKIDLKRVENCFYLDENSTYEFYGIFNVIKSLIRFKREKFILL